MFVVHGSVTTMICSFPLYMFTLAPNAVQYKPAGDGMPSRKRVKASRCFRYSVRRWSAKPAIFRHTSPVLLYPKNSLVEYPELIGFHHRVLRIARNLSPDIRVPHETYEFLMTARTTYHLRLTEVNIRAERST